MANRHENVTSRYFWHTSAALDRLDYEKEGGANRVARNAFRSDVPSELH